MEQDKKLHSLLVNYGMQEPSANFDDKLMQRIANIKLHRSPAPQLINPVIKRILVVAFAVAGLSLFVIAFLVQPGFFNKYLSISLSEKIYTQTVSFFAAFWIVMSLNIWWQNLRLNQNAYNS